MVASSSFSRVPSRRSCWVSATALLYLPSRRTVSSTSWVRREGRSAVLAVELVRRGAARFGPRTAVRFGDQSLTFSQVDDASNRMANVLVGLGLQRGDRVGLLVDNGVWSIPIDFACLKAAVV